MNVPAKLITLYNSNTRYESKIDTSDDAADL